MFFLTTYPQVRHQLVINVSLEINSLVYGPLLPTPPISPLGLLCSSPLLPMPLSAGPRGGSLGGFLAPSPPLVRRQQVRRQSSGLSSTSDLGPGKSPLSPRASCSNVKWGQQPPPPPEFPLSCDSFWLKPQFLIFFT